MSTPPPSPTLRPATPSDAAAVCALLEEAQLPLDGVPGDLTYLVVAEQSRAGETSLVGAVALERHGDAALLRSTVVSPTLRGTGLGETLVRRALDDAKANGIHELVLLTTTAHGWFPRFGFTRITRDDVPESLKVSREFQGACPASAVVMRLWV